MTRNFTKDDLPSLKGGQGRSSEEVYRSAERFFLWFVLTTIALASFAAGMGVCEVVHRLNATATATAQP